MTRPARSGPAGAAVVAVLLLLTALLGGCGDDDHGPRAGDDPSLGGDATTLRLRTMPSTIRTGVVAGRLPKAERQRAVRAVARVVDGWIDAAYVGGSYPRRDFRDAFVGFTPAARRLALSHRDLLSNQDIGGRIDGVRPVHRVVVVDLLAAGRHAVGATALVRLGFTTTGDLARRFVVRARLGLSRTDGWQVFSYDASKGRAA